MGQYIGRLPELNIPDSQPFKEDKLRRSDCESNLTNLVSNINSSNGFVLAINGEWGSGKTTFVKMWEKKLCSEGFDTIFVNVWENDFLEDPLVAFIAELQNKQSVKEKAKGTLKAVISEGGKILLNAAGSTAKHFAGKYLGEETAEILAAGVQGGADSLTKYIEDYQQQSDTIRDFKAALTKLKEDLKSDTPLVFFVDELDRCRPSYAVKVLERIKHLFSVPGIVFVLSIDRTQLANAVRGFYGSENINGDEYLRRFIDIEFQLPHPDPALFCKHVYDIFKFDDIIQQNRSQRSHQDDGSLFLEWARVLFKAKGLNLRQIEKIFAQAALAFRTFSATTTIRGEVIFLLTYFSICESKFYRKLKAHEFSIDEIIIEIGKIITPEIIQNATPYHSGNDHLLYHVCEIIWMYNTTETGQANVDLLSDDRDTKLLCASGPFDEDKFLKTLKDIRAYEFHGCPPSLKYYLNHIEFVSSLQ